jgi:hypothetical protein
MINLCLLEVFGEAEMFSIVQNAQPWTVSVPLLMYNEWRLPKLSEGWAFVNARSAMLQLPTRVETPSVRGPLTTRPHRQSTRGASLAAASTRDKRVGKPRERNR